MKKSVLGLAVLSVLAVAAAVAIYRQDLFDARARLAAGGSMIETACGPIEYAAQGSGPPVLAIHGAGGGYSQLADLNQAVASSGFRVVAMSRFGYLGTPMPEDASPQAQADAHACLLDALGIRAAAAIGVSAGGPSALQFCIRHADRCEALVLLVPATHAPGRTWRDTTPPSPFMQFVLRIVLEQDFVVWALTRAWPDLMVETALATPLEVFRMAGPAEQARARALARDIFPVSPRVEGLRNDARICSDLPRYALEDIRAPTLAISVEDDLYGTYVGAKYAVSQIPHARLVAFPQGGHVFLGHGEEVTRAIVDFLKGAPAQTR